MAPPGDGPRAARQPAVSLGARLLRLVACLIPGLLLLPILAGLLGSIGPAFNLSPSGPDLVAFRDLAAWPGLPAALRLSLVTGLAATALALALTLLITATLQATPAFAVLRRLLAPLLAMPHAATAVGLAFLIAPSGWIARVLSPWATGWTRPPDLLILNDPWGLALIFGLIAKELPFLLLMTLAALPQCDLPRRMQVAATMGYGSISGFWLAVLPALYPQLRLPVLAVLAYALTNVDMALILGPTRPHSLAVQVTLWMTDPGLAHRSLAAAAALTLLAATLGAMLAWLAAERLAAALRRAATRRGLRLTGLDAALRPIAALAAIVLAAALLAGLAGLALWSLAGLWPFPDTLPQSLTLAAWTRAAPALSMTTATTILIAMIATASALTLTLAALQTEFLARRPAMPGFWLYLPLLVPQICFLPGIAHLLLTLHASGGIVSVTATHLIFVLPYSFLSLAAPFRAWDARIATVAATLGASPARIFWHLRLPMLLVPVLTAAAISLAVSIGQYLPTLLVGGGRVTTLTTEALALASGGNRRLTAAYALMQTLLPALGFGLAIALPRLVLARRNVRGLA